MALWPHWLPYEPLNRLSESPSQRVRYLGIWRIETNSSISIRVLHNLYERIEPAISPPTNPPIEIVEPTHDDPSSSIPSPTSSVLRSNGLTTLDQPMLSPHTNIPIEAETNVVDVREIDKWKKQSAHFAKNTTPLFGAKVHLAPGNGACHCKVYRDKVTPWGNSIFLAWPVMKSLVKRVCLIGLKISVR